MLQLSEKQFPKACAEEVERLWCQLHMNVADMQIYAFSISLRCEARLKKIYVFSTSLRCQARLTTSVRHTSAYTVQAEQAHVCEAVEGGSFLFNECSKKVNTTLTVQAAHLIQAIPIQTIHKIPQTPCHASFKAHHSSQPNVH